MVKSEGGEWARVMFVKGWLCKQTGMDEGYQDRVKDATDRESGLPQR